jgi:hypothetical protein
VGIRYADSGKPNDQTALHTFMQALKDVQSRKIAIRLELAASLARAAFDKD